MTLTELLRIGDVVCFEVDRETREWTNTYRDIPDGTKGVVCGFYDAVFYAPRVPILVDQPGVYHQKGAVSVWLPDGRIVPGGYSVSMVDNNEEHRRDAEMRDKNGVLHTEQIRLGDLPKTPFWEGDKVRVRFPNAEWGMQEMTIARIDYYHMHDRCNDGSPYPFYDVDFKDGGSTAAEESWVELIERGNVWKYYNNQPLVFADLKEEADFFALVGQTEEVRNPANGLYSWTKEEVLEAKNGVVHGFSVNGGFFGSGPHICARRFKNEELGKRIAQATLEGFGLVSA